jgi:nitroreductase
MDVFEAVRTVLAVRRYDSRPVPRETIDRIVEAGRLTASSMNGQPWHFVVVTEREGLERLSDAVRSGRYVRGAAFAISDGSRAIQSMILTAWDEGVGSNWTGFLGLDEARTSLGIPGDYDVLAVLPFGYPAEARRAGKKARKPIGEVASSERFGTPYTSSAR